MLLNALYRSPIIKPILIPKTINGAVIDSNINNDKKNTKHAPPPIINQIKSLKRAFTTISLLQFLQTILLVIKYFKKDCSFLHRLHFMR